MRTLIKFPTIVLVLILHFCKPLGLNAQDAETKVDKLETQTENKGILFRLTIWKGAVEQAAKEANAAPADKKIHLFQNYCSLQRALDALLTDFEYQMNNNNLLANKFNKLNKDYAANKEHGDINPSHLCNKAILRFNKNLNAYIKACKLFIEDPNRAPVSTEGGKALAIDPITLISDLATFVQNIMTYQAAKATSLSALIDKVRLTGPKDIFSN